MQQTCLWKECAVQNVNKTRFQSRLDNDEDAAAAVVVH